MVIFFHQALKSIIRTPGKIFNLELIMLTFYLMLFLQIA